MLMFITGLFTIHIGECVSFTNDGIRKMWYIYTMKFYSAAKKNRIIFICRKIDGTRDHNVT
jgi:hypothetical protein